MAGLLATACLPASADASIRISAPGLEPEFQTGQSDYVVSPEHCGANQATPFTVEATKRSRAKIGTGKRFHARTRVRRAYLADGQAISFTLTKLNGTRKVFFARCLPDDFPAYDFTRTGPTQSGLFAIDPFDGSGHDSNYSVIFSDAGLPVWWQHSNPIALDSKVIGGLITWAAYFGGGFGQNPGVRYELRRPDGTLESSIRTIGASTDHHDLQRTADGNFLILSYVPREFPRDASAFNGDSEAHVIDAIVQKVSPTGELLWQWEANAHVGLAETGRWWSQLGEPYDIHHINSVEEVDDGSGDMLVSLRHTDAVYRIDGESGDVIWKLGGTETPESLEIVGDPFGDANPLGGQHDARWLGDGEVSVYANSTGLGRPPRALRYRIDAEAGEATLLNAVEDPIAPGSTCCGSARVLGGGNWLVSWGGTSEVSELTQSGERVMRLTFSDGSFSYRAQPLEGSLSAEELRAGMDAQVPPKG